MEFIEGSRGIYRPIRVLFDTPIYERALQTCWHIGSYKVQIALVTELLRLQQNNQLPSEVTAEDMTELLVEESKSTLRVQLWEFELEDFDEADARPLLNLVWKVNTSMKMRDVEFEARRLLDCPEAVPPQFQHPKIISQAQKYARSLTEQHQEAPSSKLLGPQEVVMEVVPKVLQGFWLLPKNTSLNMPSQQLSKMAVGVTKAVEDRVSAALSTLLVHVTFTHSIRDNIVLSILEKVRQGYTNDILVKKLNCFAADVLNTITDVAAGEICVLFQPQTSNSLDEAEDKSVPNSEPDSAEVPAPPALQGLPDKPPVIKVQDEPMPPADPPANIGLDKTEEHPAGGPEADSAVVSTPLPPVIPADEPVVISTVQDELIITEQPVRVDESFNTATEVKKEKSGFSCFFSWLQRNICCSFLPEDDTETQ